MRVIDFIFLIWSLQIGTINTSFASGTERQIPRIKLFQYNHNHEKFKELTSKLSQGNLRSEKIDLKLLRSNRKILESYLESIQSVAQSEFREYNDQEKTAFLVNVYNAYTLYSLLEKNSSDLINLNPTDGIEIFGDQLTVQDFEMKFLKKRISDPRALFALFCFDSLCPSVNMKVLTAESLSSQIDEITKNFLMDTQKNRFDEKTKTLYLSPFFKKYKSEFSRHYQSPELFVAKNLMNKPKQIMKVKYGEIRVVFLTEPIPKPKQ